MRERVVTFVIVSLLSVVVWLFAEAESLGEEQMAARVEFRAAEQARDDLLVRPVAFDGRVTVDVTGSKAALSRVRAILDEPIVVSPGRLGVPDSGGRHTVRLADVFGAHPALVGANVGVEWVRPPTVDIEITELVEIELPVRAELAGIQVEGAVTADPGVARVRLPRTLAESLPEDAAAFAVLTETQVDVAFDPGPQTLSVPIVLDDDLRGERGVTLLDERAVVAFTVRSALVTQTFTAVPVQVLLPPIEMEDWRIDIDEADQILSLTVTGPRASLRALSAEGARPVAILSLSDVELASGLTSKRVSLGVIRSGTIVGAPDGLRTDPESPVVRFAVTRRAEGAAP